MKSPMKKDGKKGDLLSRGIEFVKNKSKKVSGDDINPYKQVKKLAKKAVKGAKKIAEDIKKRGT